MCSIISLPLINLLPFGNDGFGWVTPTVLVFIVANFMSKNNAT